MAEIPIDKLAEKMGDKIDDIIRGVKISTFNGVVRDTRVDTGRLIGNWQISNTTPITREIERLDPTGEEVQSEIASTVKPDTVDYLTNNLPYAAYWEERDGMIAGNAARVERNIQEKIDESN